MNLKENITGLAYLGVACENPAVCAQWYIENLGFRMVESKTVTVPSRMELAVLSLKDFTLLLYQPQNISAAYRKDGVLDHFALDAPDFDNQLSKAYGKQMKLHPSTAEGKTIYEHLGTKGVWGANFYGPGNEVVELCKDLSVSSFQTGLQGLAHLAIKIRSLEVSMPFYENLGFQRAGGGYLDTPDGRLEIRFMENKGLILELIQMVGAGLLELKTRDHGKIDHFALNVTDVESAYGDIRKMGYSIEEYGVIRVPCFGRTDGVFTVQGPDGEKIKIIEKSA